MLNVVLHAISSVVAAIDPCICGSMAEATSRVVEYRVEPRMTAAMMSTRREKDRLVTSGESSGLSDMAHVGCEGGQRCDEHYTACLNRQL